jgi:hypothetical protein
MLNDGTQAKIAIAVIGQVVLIAYPLLQPQRYLE